MENGKPCVSQVWGEVLPSVEPIGCVAALRSGLALVSGWVFPFADLCGNYRSGDFFCCCGRIMFLIFFKFMSNQAEYQMCHLFVCQTPFPVAGSAGGSERPL